MISQIKLTCICRAEDLVISGICHPMLGTPPHPRKRALKAAAKQLDLEEEAKERALLLDPAMALQNSGVHALKTRIEDNLSTKTWDLAREHLDLVKQNCGCVSLFMGYPKNMSHRYLQHGWNC